MLPPPLLPDELDPDDPELPPLDAVEDPDPLPPLLVEAPGLLLLPLPEGVDDPDPLLPEDAYTKVVEPLEEIQAHFETNLFGAVRVMQAVLPIMRKQRSGTIVNISSMGGRIAFPLSSTYSGSKFALEGITESLSYEVEQFGIKTILIEPGIVKTNFANNIKKIGKTLKPDSPYARLVEIREANRRSMVESGSINPDEVATVILNAITSDSPDLRYVVGNAARRLLESRKNMPESEFKMFMMKNFFGTSETPKLIRDTADEI